MNLTSILVVINDATKDVSNIKDNLKYAGSKTQLLVYNNHCLNEKIINELKPLATTWISNIDIFKNYSECVNELLRITTGDYIFVAREDALYSEDWLKMLINSHNFIESSGVISIYDFSTSEGTYQLTKNNSLDWVYGNDFRINNHAFFKRELIFTIGGFNEQLNGVYAFWDFCDRSRLQGFFNYFVPNTSMIRSSYYLDDYYAEPTPSEFKKREVVTFFKIFNLNTKSKENLNQLLKEYRGRNFTYNDKLGCIVFSHKNELGLDLIVSLSQSLSNLNLEMRLFCSSYFENEVLKQSFIGLIDLKK
jgi:hypothetical protein